MKIFLIILLCVTYYSLGWIAYHYINKIYKEKYNDLYYHGSDFVTTGHGFFAGLGLGIAPMIHILIEKIKEYSKKYEVKIKNSYHEQEGIIRKDNFLAFNIPEYNYMGIVEVDVRTISEKEVDKIIDMLDQWAYQEKRKNARINIAKEIRANRT